MNYLSRFSQHKLLKDLSTFGIGGPAKYFIEISSIEDMQAVIAFCYREGIDFIVIGKGSNCLFDDQGFDGLVILNKISFCRYEDNRVHVGAGYSFSLLGVQTAKKGLSGLEFASGIPASVGGAVFMNAGANQQETKDHLFDVWYVSETGELEILEKKQIEFSYRMSSFQKKKGAVVAATFLLTPNKDARAKQLSIIDYRTKTQPYGDKSAGCVFRNPTQGPAGYFIEKTGLKGTSIHGAEVSELHANFIVNKERANAADVLSLAKHVQEKVKEHTGIDLEMEIRCIPFSRNKT
jgi:UDP-N-acetylmuramate dehydrogenase